MTTRNWLPDESLVLVVAGSVVARKEAEENHRYVCQNRRSFRPSKWIAFYADGQIDLYAEIDGPPEDDVALGRPDEDKNSVFRLINLRTIGPIVNDQSRDGRAVGWTFGHRYTQIDKLLKAKRTSELTD